MIDFLSALEQTLPSDGDPWFALLLLVSLLLAGYLAARTAGRAGVAPVGGVAYLTVGWWSAARFGVDGPVAILLGLAASVIVGKAFAWIRSRAEADPDGLRPGWASSPVLVVLIVVVGPVVAVVTGVAHARAENVTARSRDRAEADAQWFDRSSNWTANDLALASGGHVLEAEGHRVQGGVDILVRYEEKANEPDSVVSCWRFLVEGTDVRRPRPEACPLALPTLEATAFESRLRQAVNEFPASLDGDVLAVEQAAELAVSEATTGPRAAPIIEAAELSPGVIAVSVRLEVTDCVAARIDRTSGEVAVDAWTVHPAFLRSDQIGCRPQVVEPS